MTTTPQNWREFVEELSPPWLAGTWGERLMGMLALTQDATGTGMVEAQRASWLMEETSPDDILQHIGNERRIERYAGETSDGYRTRLHDAWDAWAQAGNEASLIDQLEAFGLSSITVKSYRSVGWDWDSAAGLTWAEGVGGSANWSRFWVVVEGHGWTGGASRGSGRTFGDGLVRGLSATRAQVATIVKIVNKWRPAHVIGPWIVIVIDGATWAVEQPDGTWHDWRNRSASARYIDCGTQAPILLP